MWFGDIAAVDNPGRPELQAFVDRVIEFLGFVLDHQNEFAFLWEEDPKLRDLAIETFQLDVSEGGGVLRNAIPGISTQALALHGLLDRPARFKFQVVNSIANRWENAKKQFKVRGWFKQIVEAIDAILGSIVDAAGGAGGIVKEFKDVLSALAGTKD